MMQLHTILKFDSFVVLLDPLKIFQNLFVQLFDIIVIDSLELVTKRRFEAIRMDNLDDSGSIQLTRVHSS